jgi:hypothetical protein
MWLQQKVQCGAADRDGFLKLRHENAGNDAIPNWNELERLVKMRLFPAWPAGSKDLPYIGKAQTTLIGWNL